ncbi:MAG: leucine-rich repeat domain-containing protein [Promethearchaeota archaeon]|jgi:Leucine-rich repeat (LRR) protein
MRDFKVNDYITLKLEGKNTIIYVTGERFRQCKYLLLNITVEKITALDNIQSIDEAAEKLNNSLEPMANPQEDIYINDISPEVGYWAHCSNLQTWSENNYNTNILHSNLAFPLLKKLVEVGDKKAIKAFKEEIAKRLESGYLPTIKYLWSEGFIRYLTSEELLSIPNFKYTEFKHLLDIEDSTKIKFFWSDYKDAAFENSGWISVSERHISEMDINDIPDLNIFPEPITNLRGLTYLRLIGNSIKSIPKAIGNLKSLRYLDLTVNKLEKIPKTIGKCKNLKILRLSGNSIAELPSSIGDLTLLRQLELNNNSLFILPDSIGKLVNLKKLYIANNKLKTLPNSIQNLQSLESLDLQNNKFNIIPELIGNLKSLKSLLINGNKLKNNNKAYIIGEN